MKPEKFEDKLIRDAELDVYMQGQRELRERLQKNLELIQGEKAKLDAEDRALEIKEHKLEVAIYDGKKYSDAWWLDVSRLNVTVKRRQEIRREKEELRQLAISLGPIIKQAMKDVPQYAERPVA